MFLHSIIDLPADMRCSFIDLPMANRYGLYHCNPEFASGKLRHVPFATGKSKKMRYNLVAICHWQIFIQNDEVIFKHSLKIKESKWCYKNYKFYSLKKIPFS